MREKRESEAASEEGQLDQITDTAEYPDVEPHRKNCFEPAVKVFSGQAYRSKENMDMCLV
jgi:hypothetical protein